MTTKRILTVAGVLCSLAAAGFITMQRTARNQSNPPAAVAANAWQPAADIAVHGRSLIDPRHGLRVEIPQGWSLGAARARGDVETSVALVAENYPSASITLYYRTTGRRKSADEHAALREAVRTKTAQRIAAGLRDYAVEQEPEPVTLGGAQGLSWRAAYSENGVPWREFLVRVHAEDYSVLMFLIAPAAIAKEMQTVFDALVRAGPLPGRATTG
jgi:hypothetical protein